MSEAGQMALAEYSGHTTLIGFDYDGTLAPIVSNRNQAIMRNSTRMQLAQLARRRPTLIITGRSRADVMTFLVGVQLQEVIGNHGLEGMGNAATRFASMVRDWHGELDERMEGVAGLEIEDKRYSLSIHFRHCQDKDHARKVALRVAEHLDGARIVPGKEVLNIVPEGGPDKGQALLAAMSRYNTHKAIYVGDDDTDEDVFALPPSAQILRIRVGHHEDSAAQFFIKDQREIDSLLSRLAAMPLK